MKKFRKKIAIISLIAVGIVAVTGCSQTDLVGKVAKSSFKEVLTAMKDQVKEDTENGGWSLTAPDDSASFIWSKDYSKTSPHDIMIQFEAQPFIDAGLDVSKLEDGIVVDDMIMLGTDLGDDKLKNSEGATADSSFNEIVNLYRDSIGYHETLDHYGVDLGDGNKFEWAKDMSTNDKDIVFVVNPETFIDAGVDPDKVEGWTYASVKMKDSAGKTIEVMKFLKPFDIQ